MLPLSYSKFSRIYIHVHTHTYMNFCLPLELVSLAWFYSHGSLPCHIANILCHSAQYINASAHFWAHTPISLRVVSSSPPSHLYYTSSIPANPLEPYSMVIQLPTPTAFSTSSLMEAWLSPGYCCPYHLLWAAAPLTFWGWAMGLLPGHPPSTIEGSNNNNNLSSVAHDIQL